MIENNLLKQALKFDALDTAERLTGTDSHDRDSPALALGFVLLQENSRVKEALLRERGDTCFMNTLDDYIRIIEANGYQRVLEDAFEGRDGVAEKFFVYAHPDGLLLKFDTFEGDHVNGGSVYYNWNATCDNQYEYTSSGSMAWGSEIWVGDHDAREALIFKMDQLRANGSFVSPWVQRPFLWLLHYMDSKVEGYDYRAITEERISRLPQWVRDFIGEDRG